MSGILLPSWGMVIPCSSPMKSAVSAAVCMPGVVDDVLFDDDTLGVLAVDSYCVCTAWGVVERDARLVSIGCLLCHRDSGEGEHLNVHPFCSCKEDIQLALTTL